VRSGSRLFYPLFLVVTTSIALALVEVGTRMVGRLFSGDWPATAEVTQYRNNLAVHGLFRRHPWLNVTGRDSATVSVNGKSATLNSAGYRSPERPVKKPTGVKRVLCAGGSTTFDSLADRNETSWPWLLEEALRERGLSVEVWNAGMPTWTTLENTIALLARDLELEPDLLIVLQGFNDLQPAAHQPHDPTYERGHAERMLTALGFELQAPSLLERSVALERLRSLLGFGGGGAAPEPPSGVAARVTDQGLDTYRRNLRTLLAVARAHGVEVLLVTQPLRPSPAEREADRRFLGEWLGLDGAAVEMELDRANRILLEVAAQSGAGAVEAATETIWRTEDFWDPVHFGTAGSEKLADLLTGPVAHRLAGAESWPHEG
jgi:lysophospholipase L1-like esterase